MTKFLSLAQLERRLEKLERLLGLPEEAGTSPLELPASSSGAAAADASSSSPSPLPSPPPVDLSTRVSRVERRWHEMLLQHKLQSTHDDWVESLRLANEDLDPGTALTHQTQQVAAPLLYRRQEIVAQSELLKSSLSQISHIASLLLIGQSPPQAPPAMQLPKSAATPSSSRRLSPAGAAITEAQVVHAPILVESRVSDDDAKRLAVVASDALQAQQRCDAATRRLDVVLHRYQALVTAIAELTVLLDAELSRRGA